MGCSLVLSSMCHSDSGGSGTPDAGTLSPDIAASTLVRDLRDLRLAQRPGACSPRLLGVAAGGRRLLLAISLAIRSLSRNRPRCDWTDDGADVTCGDAPRQHQPDGLCLTSNP